MNSASSSGNDQQCSLLGCGDQPERRTSLLCIVINAWLTVRVVDGATKSSCVHRASHAPRVPLAAVPEHLQLCNHALAACKPRHHNDYCMVQHCCGLIVFASRSLCLTVSEALAEASLDSPSCLLGGKFGFRQRKETYSCRFPSLCRCWAVSMR